MSKVNKAFSLDPEVFILLDKYCRSHEEIGGKRKSRSAMVNEAIRWYLGDTANLVLQRDALQNTLRERNIEIDSLKEDLNNAQGEVVGLWETIEKLENTLSKGPRSTESERTYRSWWSRLLLGR